MDLCETCKHLIVPNLIEYRYGQWEDINYVYCKEINKQIKSPNDTSCRLHDEKKEGSEV